jgi:hypothetical protein
VRIAGPWGVDCCSFKYAQVNKDLLEITGWVNDIDEATLLRSDEADLIIEDYQPMSDWEISMMRLRRPKYRSIDEV